MLAGRVKLRTFLIVAFLLAGLGAVGFLALGGLGVLAAVFAPDPHSEVTDHGIVIAPAPAPPTDPEPPTDVSPVVDSLEGLPVDRAADRVISSRIGTDLGSTKLKDVSKGQPYKVNLYQDEGHPSLNRAKIDLDRDDLWDEKWTIDGDSISRKVSPGDDEDYSVSQVWSDGSWVEP